MANKEKTPEEFVEAYEKILSVVGNILIGSFFGFIFTVLLMIWFPGTVLLTKTLFSIIFLFIVGLMVFGLVNKVLEEYKQKEKDKKSEKPPMSKFQHNLQERLDKIKRESENEYE